MDVVAQGVGHRARPHGEEKAKIWLDEHGRASLEGAPETEVDDAPEPEEDERIVCRACGAAISAPSAVFAMADTDVFPNPYGQLQVILTVRWAEGYVPISAPTTEFTWFDRYAWSIICCATCRAHLGWRYDAIAGNHPPSFFGLLKKAVATRSFDVST